MFLADPWTETCLTSPQECVILVRQHPTSKSLLQCSVFLGSFYRHSSKHSIYWRSSTKPCFVLHAFGSKQNLKRHLWFHVSLREKRRAFSCHLSAIAPPARLKTAHPRWTYNGHVGVIWMVKQVAVGSQPCIYRAFFGEYVAPVYFKGQHGMVTGLQKGLWPIDLHRTALLCQRKHEVLGARKASIIWRKEEPVMQKMYWKKSWSFRDV